MHDDATLSMMAKLESVLFVFEAAAFYRLYNSSSLFLNILLALNSCMMHSSVELVNKGSVYAFPMFFLSFIILNFISYLFTFL